MCYAPGCSSHLFSDYIFNNYILNYIFKEHSLMVKLEASTFPFSVRIWVLLNANIALFSTYVSKNIILKHIKETNFVCLNKFWSNWCFETQRGSLQRHLCLCRPQTQVNDAWRRRRKPISVILHRVRLGWASHQQTMACFDEKITKTKRNK